MGRQRIHLYVSGSTWLATGHPAGVPVHGTHADPAEQKWEAVAQQLRANMGKTRSVSVVLSARLCGFIVLPWLSSCYTGSAIRKYVSDAFVATQGVTDASHRIEIHWPDYGAPILSAAFPRALVQAMQAGLSSAGFEMHGVVSSVTPVLARYARGLGAGSHLLAYGEDDGVTAITVEDGRVVQVETIARDGHGLENMATWSARKRMAFASDDAMQWLVTSMPPEGFVGKCMALQGADKPITAGHALVAACR